MGGHMVDSGSISTTSGPGTCGVGERDEIEVLAVPPAAGEVRSPGASTSLEEQVPQTVASLLCARDGREMLASLCDLVASCGGETRVAEQDTMPALRTLPDEMWVPDGRELTLGPVLRALAAAALERASGDLAPPRRMEPVDPEPRGQRPQTLVALDLGALGSVRAEFGDPGARWLVERLRRTLRSLLGPRDAALRYPASRFLVRLGDAEPGQARAFAQRVAWEWDGYLGRRLHVRTQVEPVEDGHLAASLRRISFGPPAG